MPRTIALAALCLDYEQNVYAIVLCLRKVACVYVIDVCTCIVDGIYESVPCCVRAVGAGNTVRSLTISQRMVLKEVAASKVSYSSSTRDEEVTVVEEESI